MSTALTALRVLDEVAQLQPVGVTTIAERMQMPKSSAQRALKALEASGWIRQTGPGKGKGKGWVLTTKAIDIAQRVAADVGVREVARDILTELRDATGESVHLVIREGNEVVIIDVVETVNPTRIYIPLGTRSPLHATATGKALLAHMEEPLRSEILASGLPRLTDSTITDPAHLDAELRGIRVDGKCAVVKGELREDIGSIARPVFSRSGMVVCAISVFVPMYRFPADEGRICQALTHAARQISARL
ncbi:IclR family transcriptional regulator [Kibdelosporangium philippinense]|uniref:IclR family transcriptional regulator n=1 Tax=Kibdelosporangium philippinense TaxID=211113 RepID=A0ABS8ZFP4_9PSEU|nr:IclR family transcriptional regulator [Kibdelosporangium philippinense]MCE7006347.1 IclR family transcriptional regulator [Kibdelosporangium philippinense]